MKDQLYGIEIELTGVSRKIVADIIKKYFDTSYERLYDYYDTYEVLDKENRKWKVMKDGSINPVRRAGDEPIENYSVELVSPICKYEDIEDIQQIVREIRKAKGMPHDSCGIHIHINAEPHTPQSIKNVVNIMSSKEDLLYKTLKVDERRVNRFCSKVDDDFVKKMNDSRRLTLEDIKKQWYSNYRNPDAEANRHYSETRYKGLNLHSVFYKGTLEFRIFNSTLHAGEIKSYIQLCLAISNQALEQKSARFRKTTSTNEKYTFRTWLLRLGFIGDEFKTARLHLLKNLDGCIAWKTEEQKNAQVERLKEARRTEVAIGENIEEAVDMSEENVIESSESEDFELTM